MKSEMNRKSIHPLKYVIVLLIFSIYSPAYAAWKPVESADLEAITNNMTWEGNGWAAYFKSDHTRILISGENSFAETWDIRENGTVLCSNGKVRGERCGVIEMKRNKYRSKRIEGPSKGKSFKFEVVEGIPNS